jgi:hypothetical protein
MAEILKEPFLYMEADCVPTRPGWYPEIEDAYRIAKRPFMGPIVPASARFGNPQHMAAIAVYPSDLVKFGAGDAMNANEVPFPAAAAKGIMRSVQATNLICHDPEGAGVPPGCALYHPDRNGSILARFSNGNLGFNPTLEIEPSRGNGKIPAESEGIFPLATTEHCKGAFPLAEIQTQELRRRVNAIPLPPAAALIPWQSKLESIERIRALVTELKSYCSTPQYTSTVRTELFHGGVIQPVKKKRRRRT